ncbi:MAG: 6-bladed beta-propeller [Gemmatimonadota bacterium]|nr:6-bladed beta-propeller [Gemmatimonadota bacterium]
MRFAVLMLAIGLIPAWTTTSSAQKYTIEKVREIPIDLGDEVVGLIADLARDVEGNFYMPDWQQHTVWVTDPKGKLIRRIGQEGSGPGELSRPRSISVLEDRIVVLDRDNARISVFTKDGESMATFRIDHSRPSGMAVGHDGRIVVSALAGKSVFTVYDSEGVKVNDGGSRPWPPPPGTMIMFSGPVQHLSLTPDGNILYCPVKLYEIQEMRWDGSVRVNYAAEPPGYYPMVITSIESASEELNKATRILRPLVVGNLVVVQRARNRSEPDEDSILHLDLFERDGILVQMDIESPLSFIYAEGDDLYAIDTSPVEEGELNPSIVVYQLRN